jgi:hypothetical protein
MREETFEAHSVMMWHCIPFLFLFYCASLKYSKTYFFFAYLTSRIARSLYISYNWLCFFLFFFGCCLWSFGRLTSASRTDTSAAVCQRGEKERQWEKCTHLRHLNWFSRIYQQYLISLFWLKKHAGDYLLNLVLFIFFVEIKTHYTPRTVKCLNKIDCLHSGRCIFLKRCQNPIYMSRLTIKVKEGNKKP